MSARPSPRPTLTDGCLLHPGGAGGGWGSGGSISPGGWEDGGRGEMWKDQSAANTREREKKKKDCWK